MAVLVQEMVEASHAGVVFTADPLTGATDRFVVECVSGLGEELVQGTVQPERMEVEKRTGRVLASPENKLLSPATLENLCELACRTEHLFGSPQDIEWAQRDGGVFLLQSRPITTKAPVKTWEDRQVWTNVNTGEVIPDVMTPITWSMMQSLLGVVGSIFRLVGADITRAPQRVSLPEDSIPTPTRVWLRSDRFPSCTRDSPILPGRWEAIWWRPYRQAPLTLSPGRSPRPGSAGRNTSSPGRAFSSI